MKSILILQDQPIVMNLMCLALEDYKIFRAKNAEHALRLFRKYWDEMDLLMADVTLPVSSGIHVALLFRTRLPRLPVILTARYPPDCWNGRDLSDLVRLGSDGVGFLEIPFVAASLRTIVQVYTAPAIAGPALESRNAIPWPKPSPGHLLAS